MRSWLARTCAGVLTLAATAVSAQSRCDCSRIVDACTATGSFEGDAFVFRSSTPQCSQVFWHFDEQPRLTVVLDGEEREAYGGSAPNPRVVISDCRVCADRAWQQRLEANPQPAVVPFHPVPLVRVPADYPARAQARGIEGRVAVRITVAPDGRVVGTEVVSAAGAILDEAALAAARLYRFAPSDAGGSVVAPFTFKLDP